VSLSSLIKHVFTCDSSTGTCITSIKDFTLTFREEHKLRVLRRTFGPKMEEVTLGYTNVHNVELQSLHSTSNMYLIKARIIRQGMWNV
jgi:hypothetical protein